MPKLARRLADLALIALPLVLAAGCGTRTPLDLHADGAPPGRTDGGTADGGRMDGGGGGECRVDSECDDGRMCTGREFCVGGRCQPGMPFFCIDEVECTIDECVEGRGCVSRPDDSLCPPGTMCDPSSGCVGRPCGTDAECDDGAACNGVEACGPDGICHGGVPLDCADAIDCTIDSCEEPRGMCTHTPDGARCATGMCDPMLGCLDRRCRSSAECDDGLVCNGTESCSGGRCVPGPRPACDDGVACTVDACSEAARGCTSTPDSRLCPAGQLCDPMIGCTVRGCRSDGGCDDGLFCNGTERCDAATGVCVAGPPPSCDDGEACTVDRCVEMLGCFSEPRATREVCGNRIDDDCDRLIDCADDDCRGAPGCPTCTPTSMTERACFDGRDDDCDGRIDCMDPDCAMACTPRETDCRNRIDDDGDGVVDCADPDCRLDPGCRDGGIVIVDAGPPRDSGPRPPAELGIAQCTNGIDDDGDGRIDCADSDCRPLGPMSECCNGIDDDGDGTTDVFTCRCFDNSTCVGVSEFDQVCWTTDFSLCAPRCNFYGGDSFCRMWLPDMPRCNRTTGECTR